MPNPVTNFKTSTGTNVGDILVTREYVLDVYPDLLPAYNDNTLWMCGNNAGGQLGDNTIIYRSSMVQTIAGGTNWKQVTVGGESASCAAIKTDGTLWMWGNNVNGQLGDKTIAHRSSPVQIAGTNWKSISIGSGTSGNVHTVATKTDGTLWSWGINNNGRLGDNTIISKSSPVQIAGVTWKQVSCGPAHTAAIKTDGTLWAWGGNDSGQLGLNDLVHRSSPVQVGTGRDWKQVSLISTSTIAVKTNGTLWAWGGNDSGQLGLNDLVHRSSPVQVGTGINWEKIAGSASIKTDGTLWTWGSNASGQLGDNTIINKSSPVQIAGTTWKQITNSSHTMTAIKTDGTLWVWGHNLWGQLSNNMITHRSSPVQISGTTWKQASACTVAAFIKDEAI